MQTTVQLTGRDRITALPAASSQERDDAVLVRVHESSDEWSSRQAPLDHEDALRHLGTRFFFGRVRPSATTTGPNLGLADRTSSAKTLQVITGNGEDFSVLASQPDLP